MPRGVASHIASFHDSHPTHKREGIHKRNALRRGFHPSATLLHEMLHVFPLLQKKLDNMCFIYPCESAGVVDRELASDSAHGTTMGLLLRDVHETGGQRSKTAGDLGAMLRR